MLTYDDIKMVQSFVAYVFPSESALFGREIWTNAVLLCRRHPEPLEYRFRPRTKAMQTLVLADMANEAGSGS